MKNHLLPLFFWLYSTALPSHSQTPHRIYEDIYREETTDRLRLRNAAIRVEIDKKTGDWTGLFLEKTGQNLLRPTAGTPAVEVVIGGKPLVVGAAVTLLRHSVRIDPHRRGVTLEVVLGIGPEFELTCRYTLQPGISRLERSALLTRLPGTSGAVKLSHFRFLIPAPTLGPNAETVVDVPGPFFPKTLVLPATAVDSLLNRTIGFHSAPDAGFGVLALTNHRTNQTFATWMNTAGETNYRPFLIGDGRTISLAHDNYRYHRLLPGQSVESDEQVVVLENGLDKALAQYREMVNETMPLDGLDPAWVREAVILEVYPNYFKEGFRGITKKLPFYRQVGFNVIYMMPHWKGGYSPLDLFAVDPKFGTEADLKVLVKTAHDLGMKVLFDMVIHGFNQKSDVPKQRPELFVRAETGDSLAWHPTWRSITADWAAPAYQQYMVDLVGHDLRTYGIDGYRVDAASYKGPAWHVDLPYPAYRPGSAAPELMRAMLDTLRSTNPEAMLLSEVFGPVFYSVSNLGHDNQTEAGTVWLERLAEGRSTAEQYKTYLANVFAMLPAGANRVFFARNHDTSWFFHFNGYSPLFLAFDSIHALVGIPEVFAGDPDRKLNPDDDPATYEYYRKLFKARRERSELTRGDLILEKTSSNNPMVFSAMRRLRGKESLVLVSLSGKEEAVKTTVTRQPLPATIEFFDPISGKKFTANPSRLTLKPFQVLIGKVK